MIKKIKADGVQEVEFLAKLGERSRNTNKDVTETVSEIINNVMMNGDKAVREYTIKFDGKAPDAFEVPKEELTALTADCDPEFIATLKKAADNIRNFHERQKQQSWLTTKDNGVIMGLKACRSLCSGRYSSLSVICSYECYSCKNCRSF